MYPNQHNPYLQTSIQTATPAQLLMMLYDGAIRFCRLGIEAIKQQKYEVANENLFRAQNIINELIVSLDKDAEVTQGLSQLYEYFNYRLIEANTKKTVEPVEEVLEYLLDLKQTWTEAVRQPRLESKVVHG